MSRSMGPNDVKCAFWRSSPNLASGRSPRVSLSLTYIASILACEKGLGIQLLSGPPGRPGSPSGAPQRARNVPRRPRNVPPQESARTAREDPKGADGPSGPWDRPGGPKDGPGAPRRRAQEAQIEDLHKFFNGFRAPAISRQEGPETARGASRNAPRRPKRPRRGPQDGPREHPNGPGGPQEDPGKPLQTASRLA